MKDLQNPSSVPIKWVISWNESINGQMKRRATTAIGQFAFQAHAAAKSVPAFGSCNVYPLF